MSESIRRNVESFIQRGVYLQFQLSFTKAPKTIKDDIARDAVGEAVKIFTRDVLELPWGGEASKYTKALIKQQEAKQKAEAERVIELEFNLWIQNITSYLSSVSIVRPDLSPEGNSYELVNRLKGAQDCKRLETKIRSTITTLRAISAKNLILNQDIPSHLKNKTSKKPMRATKETIIPPERPFTGERALADIIQNTEGYVWVLDPYVDEKTLDLLCNAPIGIPIRLLTCFTGGDDKERRFLRLCAKFKVEQPGFEIRKCDSKLIHDRFILTKDRGWSVGSSLKDTGKKLTMIKELSQGTKEEIHSLFEGIWSKSGAF